MLFFGVAADKCDVDVIIADLMFRCKVALYVEKVSTGLGLLGSVGGGEVVKVCTREALACIVVHEYCQMTRAHARCVCSNPTDSGIRTAEKRAHRCRLGYALCRMLEASILGCEQGEK